VRNNSLVYDERRRAMLLVDGTPEAPGAEVVPIARAGAALVNDARNQRLLYVAGYRGLPPLQDLWQHDARGWRLWLAPGTTLTLAGPQSLALSVADLEASARWYRELFGLATTMDVRADSNTQVRILTSEHLVVELIADKRAKPVAEHAGSQVPMTQVHGIFKAGFFVPDLDSAIAVLRERHIPVEGRWLESRPRNLMLRDNSGNLIQLIERRR
jgi:catechol 2,3-dioxygenase-like lactoylglutathione lyase family enzyme